MIPYWFGLEVQKYTQCEEELHFDQHMLKALAPRVLLQTGLAPEYNPYLDMELIFEWKVPTE